MYILGLNGCGIMQDRNLNQHRVNSIVMFRRGTGPILQSIATGEGLGQLLHLTQVARNKGREAIFPHPCHHRQMKQVCGFLLRAWGRLPRYVCQSPCTTQSIMALGGTMLSPQSLGQTYLLFNIEVHIDNMQQTIFCGCHFRNLE